MPFSIIKSLLKFNNATFSGLFSKTSNLPIKGWQQAMTLVLHEHHNMEILKDNGVRVPPFGVASSPEEAQQIANQLDSSELVVKAQVLAGGRGKGHFDSGLKGGVQMANSSQEVFTLCQKMLGKHLITKQTTEAGLICQKVLVTKRVPVQKEFYFAITNESEFNGPVIMASSQGGMDIEEVAARSPDAILKHPVDICQGLLPEAAENIARQLGFSPSSLDQASTLMLRLYDIFIKYDVLMLEINPLCFDVDNQVLCLDAKFRFDDNASFRHPELFQLQDWSQKDAREKLAFAHKLSFVPLTGQIGCMVNGAGLAMATMDQIKIDGGEPANFLDLGGGVGVKQVTEAFRLLSLDPNVKVILINIFGGIVQCDIIVEGIIKAIESLQCDTPTVCRLQGSKVAEAKALLAQSKLKILGFDGLEEASKKAVELAHKAIGERREQLQP